jgi:hypothetical protein
MKHSVEAEAVVIMAEVVVEEETLMALTMFIMNRLSFIGLLLMPDVVVGVPILAEDAGDVVDVVDALEDLLPI